MSKISLVGHSKSGAKVVSYSNPFYTVECACGGYFQIGRTRLLTVLRVPGSHLHCRACLLALHRLTGLKSPTQGPRRSATV